MFIIKDTHFCVKNFKMKRKNDKKCLTFWSGDSNPRFSVIFPPRFEFSWKVRVTRSNLGEEAKISLLYYKGQWNIHLSSFNGDNSVEGSWGIVKEWNIDSRWGGRKPWPLGFGVDVKHVSLARENRLFPEKDKKKTH